MKIDSFFRNDTEKWPQKHLFLSWQPTLMEKSYYGERGRNNADANYN